MRCVWSSALERVAVVLRHLVTYLCSEDVKLSRLLGEVPSCAALPSALSNCIAFTITVHSMP